MIFHLMKSQFLINKYSSYLEIKANSYFKKANSYILKLFTKQYLFVVAVFHNHT